MWAIERRLYQACVMVALMILLTAGAAEGSTRYLGLAADTAPGGPRVSELALFHPRPNKIYLISFNTTGVSRIKVAEDWIDAENRLEEEEGAHEPVGVWGRGGASVYSALGLGAALPMGSDLLIVTGRAPSDSDLLPAAVNTLNAKNIRVTVVWSGGDKRGSEPLTQLANSTGGTVINWPNKKDVNALTTVTLAVREEVHGHVKIPLTVDSSLSQLMVTLEGPVTRATLRSPEGKARELAAVRSEGNWSRTAVVPLRGAPRGLWLLEAKGEGFNVRVQALSHIALWAHASDRGGDGSLEVWLEGKGLREVEGVSVVDGEGREVANLEHRDTSGAQSLTAEVKVDPSLDKNHFIQVRATDRNGEELTRVARVTDAMLPTSIEVALGSMLTANPGQRAAIFFEVTNNRPIPLMYNFQVNDNYRLIRRVQPTSAVIGGRSSEQVRVELQSNPFNGGQTPSQPDVVTFSAVLDRRSGESVTKKAYFRIGASNYDSTSPYIYYSYNGDCSNTLGPNNCYIASWGANITIQDTGSGLLKIKTEPVALQLSAEFIAGTLDPVYGQFTTSCCNTKVEVVAEDVLGNKYSRIIDIERKWLTAGEISAIVLGVLLLLLILLGIIACIVVCCRRRRNTLAIYPEH